MRFQFIKCQGSGNDFILLNEMNFSLPVNEKGRSDLAKILCNRQTGVGADGLIFVQKSSDFDAKMQIINADGSEASMCGNGLRCVTRYVSGKLKKPNLVIETMLADLRTGVAEDIYPGISAYKVEISPIHFEPEALQMKTDLPKVINERLDFLDDSLTFSAVAVPNPHLITFITEDYQFSKQEAIAEKLNNANPWFADGVNVSFAKKLAENAIYVRTYERGVGFTNSCGTAMAASSLIACELNYCDVGKDIYVYNHSGYAKCYVHEDLNRIDLTGNVTYEFFGEVDMKRFDNWSYTKIKEFPEEIELYEKFKESIQS